MTFFPLNRLDIQTDLKNKLERTLQDQTSKIMEKELHLSQEAAFNSQLIEKIKAAKVVLFKKTKNLNNNNHQLFRKII